MFQVCAGDESKYENLLTDEKVGFVLFMLFEYMKQNKYRKLNWLLLLSAELELNVITKIPMHVFQQGYY